MEIKSTQQYNINLCFNAHRLQIYNMKEKKKKKKHFACLKEGQAKHKLSFNSTEQRSSYFRINVDNIDDEQDSLALYSVSVSGQLRFPISLEQA